MSSEKSYYSQTYDKWYPWVEDQYLYYFGKDNKASYATKDQLSKTKVTGVEPVDKLQDGVNETVGGQVGKGGLLQGVGDAASKHGINRAERGGKDESGSYGGSSGVTDGAVDAAKGTGSSVAEGAKGAGSSVSEGAKSAGGYLSGWMGGSKEEKK